MERPVAMPHLARILIYPVKSLPAVEVATATITASGALRHDREFALVDAQGRFFNGKRHPAVHRLDAALALAADAVMLTLRHAGRTVTATLGVSSADDARVEQALSAEWGEPVRLVHRPDGGFPDDSESPGPTVVTTASLAEVAGWYPGCGLPEMRRRFRANLEIDDAPPFWEDRLYGAPGIDGAFRVGEVHFTGVNPCLRCVVPTRDPASGEEMPGFQRTFVARRRAALPSWVHPERFDVAYRLAVNTRVDTARSGRTLRVGDAVAIL